MKHNILILLLLLTSTKFFGQWPSDCSTNTLRVSTGFNPNVNALTGSGYDGLWVVVADNEPSTSEPRPATVVASQWWYLTSPTANWISSTPTSTYTSNNPEPKPFIILEYKFCVNAEVNLNTLSASLKLASDDYAELYLNNHLLGVTTGGYMSFTSINVSTGSGYFVTGSNALQIRMRNIGGTVMGAILDGVFSSPTTGPTGAFATAQCCNDKVFLTGQKFADLNGNGIKDPDESPLPGWTIKLRNSSGTVIATAVTDIYGNYYFSNIPTNPVTPNNTISLIPGNYTVEENLISSFYQTAPAGTGKHAVGVGYKGVFSGMDFGNAPCLPGFSILASPSPFCLNEPVSFSIVGPPYLMLSNYNFTWNFGDGTTASGPVQTHIYTTGGNKNVTISGGPVMPVECTINTTNITINQSESCCPDCLPSFQPIPNRKYVLSAWVSEETLGRESFIDPEIYLKFATATGVLTYGPYTAKGNVIDGWQRVEQEFTVPYNATDITVQLSSRAGNGSGQVYFDDVRIHPFDASFKSYVYDPVTLKFTAELDNNNYATFYEYDEEGKLVRVKKETERKTVTVKESRNSTIKR